MYGDWSEIIKWPMVTIEVEAQLAYPDLRGLTAHQVQVSFRVSPLGDSRTVTSIWDTHKPGFVDAESFVRKYRTTFAEINRELDRRLMEVGDHGFRA